MAKLYFYYASMNAGKSTNLLQADFNYRERGMATMLFTAAIDDRFAPGTITSRIGLTADATMFDARTDLAAAVLARVEVIDIACVLVDEAQFLTARQVDQLAALADAHGIPVLAYGLRTDFRGQLFEGSARLLALADSLIEIKSVCACGRKATMNLRVDAEGNAVRQGAQTEIGGEERYIALCRRHFSAAMATGRVTIAPFVPRAGRADPVFPLAFDTSGRGGRRPDPYMRSMTPDNIVARAAVYVVPLVIAIVFHEVAHGWVARLLGDPTAHERRRLSLNPLRHVDPIGTILLPLGLALAHAPVFGWAKPVPVDARRLREPRTGMMLVAIAGPATNFALALVAAVLLGLTWAPAGGDAATGWAGFWLSNVTNFLMINVFLALFNLLPFPPFDGGHIVQGLLPRPLAARWAGFSRYAMLAAILLIVVVPMVAPRWNVVGRVVAPIADSVANGYLSIADRIA